jgi:two-component system OmpR family response regulator
MSSRPAGPVLLVVEDEPGLRDVLVNALRFAGFETVQAACGMDALRAVARHRPDLIVLDVLLPDLTGFEIVRQIRGTGQQTPVLFLTARDATEDKVHGLRIGGDDYVTKPFSLDEVLARVEALLRRRPVTPAGRRSFADLELDEDSRDVWRAGRPVQLSPTEFRLLHYLMTNPNRVLSREQILDTVWDFDFRGNPRIVEFYVSALRRKVDHVEPRLIHTHRGVGYTLRLPPG